MQIPIIPFRGQKKPFPSIPRINRAHPLARGLVSYGYDIGFGPIDLVSGRSRTLVNTTQITGNRTSKFGNGFLYAGTASATAPCQVSLPTSPAFGSLTNGGVYSFAAAVFMTATTAGNPQLYGSGDSTANTPFAIVSDSATTAFLTEYANASTVSCGTGTNTINVYHTILGVASASGTASAYLDGKLITTSAVTTALTQPGVQPQYAGFSSTASGQSFQAGYVFYGAAWNRALNAAEAFILHNDPYCFLIYPEDEMFATLVGSAVTPPGPGPNFLTSTMPMMGVG